MSEETIDERLMTLLKNRLPLAIGSVDLRGQNAGLVIVDEVKGFCQVGGGNLAPITPNPQIDQMVNFTDLLAKKFASQKLPIMAFLDTHEKGKPEPPYPPHCEKGSDEENLVVILSWLYNDHNATIIRKDCINSYIGAITPENNNFFTAWLLSWGITDLVVVGICTDICVMQFVQTVLSARNHNILNPELQVHVYVPACATYDLPKETAIGLGLLETSAHPQLVTNHMGLYFMQQSGAHLVQGVTI